ncbi:6-hydroxymethylpterin diphosphokinase MptE-like protein [Bacillus sp. Hm123]|uniref:6-hydroxymethylpterin diphosphokinase MptE-like protein n=1 Tax=Bacillus sp. Hm123 TaxID=3450745 RepID=UPI003F42F4BD
MKITIVETRTVPTIKIEDNGKLMTFHSKYDPLREAKIWSENASKHVKKDENIVVIGLGAGYHIQALANLLPNQSITVIEFNDTFFHWFKSSPFHELVANLPNVSVKSFTQLPLMAQTNLFSDIRSTNLLIHKHGLDIFPNELGNVKAVLDHIKLQNGSLQHQIENMKTNFEKNIALNDQGTHKLMNRHKDKPMILVSADPSLNKQLPLLKQIRTEQTSIIGAVATAIKPLMQHGVTPDFFRYH